MFKQGQLKAQLVQYVQITKPFNKVHSNVYSYNEGHHTIEFVGNVAPAVGGFIVQTNQEPPIFVPKEEFHSKYMLEEEWKERPDAALAGESASAAG